MLNNEVVERTKSLKILFAITKSPKMSDLVYKAERKHFSKQKLQEISDKAVLTLRQYRFDESGVDNFIEKMYNSIFDQVTDLSMVRHFKTQDTRRLESS